MLPLVLNTVTGKLECGQDSNEQLDWTLGFTEDMADMGVVIATFEVVLPNAEIEVVEQSHTDTHATAFLRYVDPTETKYLITYRITTTGSTPRIIDKSFTMKRKEA